MKLFKMSNLKIKFAYVSFFLGGGGHNIFAHPYQNTFEQLQCNEDAMLGQRQTFMERASIRKNFYFSLNGEKLKTEK